MADAHSLQSFQDDSKSNPPPTKPKPAKMSDRDPLINRSDKFTRSGETLQDEPDNMYDRTVRPCIAELIGVMLFVFIGTTAIGSSINTGLLGIALAHGLTIALMVTATGSISGGHLNPAVTLGALFAGAIPPIRAIFYVLAQLVGGIIGAALSRGVLGDTVYAQHGGGAHTLGANVTVGEGFLCEVVLTAVLVTTVFLTAIDPESKSDIAPLAIGFAVAVDILAGGNITGASMNPARSFGPAVVVSVFDSSFWAYHWIYWVGPAVGSLLASIWYRFFLASPEKRLLRFSR